MSEVEPNKETTLHYIDKLVAIRERHRNRMRRFYFAHVVLSLVLLGICGGIVLPDPEGHFTVQGIGLNVSQVMLLTGAALIIGALDGYITQDLARLGDVNDVINRLYKSIGWQDSTLDRYFPGNVPAGTPEGPSIGDNRKQISNTFKQWSRMERVEGVVSPLLLPAAQTAVGLKVSELLQGRGLGWIWVLYVLMAYTTIYITRPAPKHAGIPKWEQFFNPAVQTLLGLAIAFLVVKVLG